MKKFKIIDHTADIGIEVYGKNLNELFANAARGMFSIITELDKVKNVESTRIEIFQPTLEDLLRLWLGELLFKQNTEEMLFNKFDVQIDEQKLKLNGRASGEKFNAERHHLKTEIKAVTYHQLEIERCAINLPVARHGDKHFRYRARVIFDV